ncbi:MAG: UDP-N-acetylmuramoyl-L-alanyl-D-glutamate--2,6-diaminopimelate ligase [Pseudomonadota bacterium]
MAARALTPITLSALTEGLGRDGVVPPDDIPVADISSDSRTVAPGAVFLALPGVTHHGIDFADQALAAGAAAIITDLDSEDLRVLALGSAVPVVCLAPSTRLGSELAGRFFARPTMAMDTAAITGTNGKTTITWLVTAALNAARRPAAMMGTLGYGIPPDLTPQALTTPDAVTFQRQARVLADRGAQALIFEASSHAIAQGRIAAADIDVAMFANLTRDHLDYHGDMEAYFEAKAALFDHSGVHARIICIDDDFGRTLWRRHSDDAWCVATHPDAVPACNTRTCRFVAARRWQQDRTGLTVDFTTHVGDLHVASQLHGDFNVQNLALALSAILGLGIPPSVAVRVLGDVAAPPGRMQRVGSRVPAVYVDYSHTPAALQRALSSLRATTSGRLWCVFGCGGERDRGKRPMMARASELADRVVVTSDNPRGENPEQIIDDIIGGLSAAPIWCDADRADAIRYAVSHADVADAVLIAGKGHESVQWIDGVAHPFDDAKVAAAALAERGGA